MERISGSWTESISWRLSERSGVGTEVHDHGYDWDEPVILVEAGEIFLRMWKAIASASLWDLAEFSTCPAYSNAS